MMELFEEPGGESGAAGNAPALSVSEISGAVKRVIEGEFGLIRVRGELGRISRPASGHLYLDLKDDRAVLAGIVWKGRAQALSMRPEEGMEVIATGRLTTFPGQSKYQMIIEDMAPAGVGALMAMLEKRRAMLAAEGLFDASRKRKLPFLPEVIGVVTSPSGAVIRDILHRLRDRFPRRVVVWPVAVQGAASAPEVARAIAGFNALTPSGPVPRPDLIIVARGGGSIEDLWGFNEEAVVRAAAASEIPLISAVGHETDTTLIDFAADVRAPTPTAAAELAVPVRMELLALTGDLGARMRRALVQGVALRGQRLRDLGRALPQRDALLAPARQRFDHLAGRLPMALRAAGERKALALARVPLRPAVLDARLRQHRQRLEGLVARLRPDLLAGLMTRKAERFAQWQNRLADRAGRAQESRAARLAALAAMLDALGPEATLQRGYAIVRGDGQVVTGVTAAKAAARIEIQFADGRMEAGMPPRKPSKPKFETPPEQGSLL